MDFRASLGTAQHHRSRARLPQRAVTGGPHALPQAPGLRMTLPPKLSTIRSTSQPVNFVDLTEPDADLGKRNLLPFLPNTELVASPDDATGVDDDLEPPTKRVKAAGDDFQPLERAGDDQNGDSMIEDEVHRVHPGSPLPAPPAIPSITARLAAHRRHRLGIEPSARKAHGLEPPAAAVRLPPPKKAADFSPWTNSHPEDILNENVVKTGYFDKTQGANQAECNSAKATISASLNQKNNPGLSLLGYLFTTALERRQASGKVTAPSTFKPPPRVTVTDTKREAWLRDLANPEIPLRKQSRTIPHGIRGKLLMEQCLAKNIPLQRAIWLAKCVGANELRAFRRKGVSGSAAASGEAKWVREWTTHVQQFLEDVIATCGQDNWRRKMNYAVKLGHAFYSEKLLDKDHFLDWIVTSVTETTRASLPIWLVLAQLYWKDLTLYARPGRKLAEGILHHLDSTIKAGQATDAPLKTRLQQLVLALAMTSRACLIIPRRWEEFKHLFTTENMDRASTVMVENIIRRNENLARPLQNAKQARSPLLQLCSELDSIGLEFDITKLADRCLTLVPDTTTLVQALFDWASTPYRTGISRVYLTAHIVAQLHTAGTDTDSAILRYLRTTQDSAAACINRIHRIIVELVHLKAFSIGGYMRWLITSGMVVASGGATCATGLVTALPSAELPVHVINTRKTLLKRIGLPSDETDIVLEVVHKIDAARKAHAEEQWSRIEIPQGLSISAKFDLCRNICDWIGLRAKEDQVTLEDICMARDLVEQVEDLHSLSTLVQSTLTTDNSTILATLCETINLHAESFAATGELTSLMDGVTDRYIALRSSQPLERTFILALQGLAERLPNKAALVKLLKDDLLICEQQSSLAVCSPASDSLIGMHASTLDSDEDLDAVFASGNTMDDQLMQRVFIRVLQRASKHSSHVTGGTMNRVCGWLNQLRSVDGAGMFDNLMRNHISSILKSDADFAVWASGIVHLVASGCLALTDVVDVVAGEIQSPETAARVLTLFLSKEALGAELHDVERYRFAVQQDRCTDLRVERLFTLVRVACEGSMALDNHPDVVAFVIRAMTRHPPASITADSSELSNTKMEALFTAILHCGSATSESMTIRDIINVATLLSIPFCIASLQCNKDVLSPSNTDDQDLADALLQAFNTHSEVWPQLLECAGEKVNAKVRDWAKDQVLLMAAGVSPRKDAATMDESHRLLSLLAVSSSISPEADDTATVLTITERLKDLAGNFNDLTDLEIGPEHQADKHDALSQLHILLQLVKLHILAPTTATHAPPSSQEARIPLLAILCSLITAPRLQLSPQLQESLFDLASTLADCVSDPSIAATKGHCTPATLADKRVDLILGSISDSTTSAAENTLMLASHIQPSISSQQQRLLNRQHSMTHLQQQHSPSSASRMPMQAQAQHQRVLSQGGIGSPSFMRGDGGGRVFGGEVKLTPFVVRQWEIISDAAPVMGENDGSLSLRLFGARKVT